MKDESCLRAKYSIIMLAENQNGELSRFTELLSEIFSTKKEPFEIIILTNGDGATVGREIDDIRSFNGGSFKAFEMGRCTFQACCLNAALEESNGSIIVVCSSHQQITRESFDRLIESLDSETDIVVPWRQRRVDSFLRCFQSRVFNELVHRITKSQLHDLSCKVKIFRRKILEEVDLYGNMYRFLPILASQKGFKTKEVACEHYPGKEFNVSKKNPFYRLSEYFERIIDVFTLYFIMRFTKKPMRFFGSLGMGFLLTGLAMTIYIFFERFFLGHPIGGRTLLLFGILLMVTGVAIAGMGLLGEIIAFTFGRQKPEYAVEKKI